MRIGIVGAGNMARALGVRFAAVGHEVRFGARRPEQAAEAAELAGPAASPGSIAEAAVFGEVVIWTTREVDVSRVLADPGVLAGQVVVDLNNRDFAGSVATGELPGRSLAERLQQSAPGAFVVKAFNCLPLEVFDCSAEDLRAADAQTFLAGSDDAAKRTVADLAASIGFRAVDVGTGEVALRAVEALADVARILIAGHGLQAHLRLDRLPDPTLGIVGSRVTGEYT